MLWETSPILLPMLIAGVGLLFSALSTYAVRLASGAEKEAEVQRALNFGNWLAMGLTAVTSYFLVMYLLPSSLELRGVSFRSIDVFYVILLGLAIGALMSLITEYYTSMGRRPVLSIVARFSYWPRN